MKALIAAGGRGTRLRPITYTMNKHLIPLVNKPMIVHAIEKIVDAGITQIAININEGDTTIEEACGDGSAYGAQLTYIEQQGGALGVGHVVKNAQEWLGDDSFVFYLGDNIVLGAITPLVEEFKASGANGFLALSEVHDPQRFGVPEINEKGEIVRVLEKPENPPSNYAVTGIYCYDKTVHDVMEDLAPSGRGELEISDVHTKMIENGGVIKYKVMDGWWKDTGKPESLLEGNHLMMEHMEEYNNAARIDDSVSIEGKIQIAEGVQLVGNTKIVGPVSIAKDAVITDSVIGPHVTIGSGTTVSGVTIQKSIIMDDATIEFNTDEQHTIIDATVGHNASLKYSGSKEWRMILGENTNVEM